MIPELSDAKRFRLNRLEDVSGVSGTGHVADGVLFADGSCALRWRSGRPSTTYNSIDDLEFNHCHGGKTRIEWIDTRPSPAFVRGVNDCYQDQCEGCPFASIGGLELRPCPRAPDYVAPSDADEYMRGYIACARDQYGENWRSVPFGWAPALQIGGDEPLALEAGPIVSTVGRIEATGEPSGDDIEAAIAEYTIRELAQRPLGVQR